MKKYTVLFAALAVIALAGCKKEENGMVNIKVGGENYMNIDKQGYSPDFQYVMFQNGDQILFNGNPYTINLMNEDPMFPGYSNTASFNVPATEVGGETTILYPYSAFQYGLFVEESAADLTMVDETSSAVNQVTGCAWPMGYYVADFHSHGDIVLKNAVALITPSIKYGAPCFQNLVANNAAFANLGTITPATLPTMTVTKVELVADQKLTGNAHVEFDADHNPIMTMDDAMAGTTDVLAAAAPNMGVVIPAQGNGETYVGSIPVTPNLTGANMWMKVYFDLEVVTPATDVTPETTHTYHCVYATPEASPVNINGHIQRSYRTVFIANMFTGSNWNRISLISID